jgi:hypothetical protein
VESAFSLLKRGMPAALEKRLRVFLKRGFRENPLHGEVAPSAALTLGEALDLYLFKA